MRPKLSALSAAISEGERKSTPSFYVHRSQTRVMYRRL